MKYIILYLLLPFLFASKAFSQVVPDTFSIRLIAAGPEYKRSASWQRYWGKNRREEWITPVKVPVLWLDKVYGDLTPIKQGGGNESRSLRLKNPDGKQYTIRSVNKSRADVVENQFKNTFVEDIIVDGISMSHPYGALMISVMADAAGIYHTNPKLVYVPSQAALDTFNSKFGNSLYIFEERLDGDWSDAVNLGNFKNFHSTYYVIEKLAKDNRNRSNQKAYLKARLFDMLIADWDRHEDQWQWGSKDTGNMFFEAVPRDRDQAFFTHKGILIDRMLPATGLGFMQNFADKEDNISGLNLEERRIDRFFTNELTLNDWTSVASSLQHSLTDDVIERSVRQLPPEVFNISGKADIEKLKSRRQQLADWARQYYLYISKDVQVAGSKKSEHFEVVRTDTTTLVTVKDDHGNQIYSRKFRPAETKEIRLFGIDGADTYSITGNGSDITVRVIGGMGMDTVNISGSRVHIYDERQSFISHGNARLHLSNDSAVHRFDYTYPLPDQKGVKFSVFYNQEDRLYAGVGYGSTKRGWRKEPYVSKQFIGLQYSISQKAFSAGYNVTRPMFIGRWSAFLKANYDAVRWTNFFGTGNNSIMTTDDNEYFRMRTVEWMAETGLLNNAGKSAYSFSAFFQAAKIIPDNDGFIAKVFSPIHMDAYEQNNYAGARFAYTYLSLNDSILPTRGITFSGNASVFSNISQSEFFQKYVGKLQVYLPLGNKFSVALRAGGTTVSAPSGILNSSELYEHAIIGGVDNLRGFKRERFWGKSSFFNNNELRFITNIRTHLLNARSGLLMFYDDGRVWMPGENSDKFHTACGGGIIFAPFKFPAITVTYGVSPEAKLIQVKMNKLF